MASPFSPGIHLDNGTHHQHAGTSGANPAGKHGANQKKTHVDARGTRQIPLQGNVA